PPCAPWQKEKHSYNTLETQKNRFFCVTIWIHNVALVPGDLAPLGGAPPRQPETRSVSGQWWGRTGRMRGMPAPKFKLCLRYIEYMATTQTPRQDKYTHWAFTAFDPIEMGKVDASGNYPQFVKTIYGGREICKTSGREHWQGHVHCRAPQRFAAIKKWLPTAHIEPARDIHASIQYALKDDTSAGDKKAMVNPTPYVTDRVAMEKLVAVCGRSCECVYVGRDDIKEIRKDLLCHLDEKEDYWHRVRAILMDEPDLCGMYAKPDLFRLWKNTKSVWIARKRGGIVLPPSRSTNEIIISSENINATQVYEETPSSQKGL
uniref:hypothetical protein n=1 Tax=Polynucleobacter sp. TaxID=2029855 RepID=UPI004047EF96